MVLYNFILCLPYDDLLGSKDLVEITVYCSKSGKFRGDCVIKFLQAKSISILTQNTSSITIVHAMANLHEAITTVYLCSSAQWPAG